MIARYERLGGELKEKAVFIRVVGLPRRVLLEVLVLIGQQEVPAWFLVGLCGDKSMEVRGGADK